METNGCQASNENTSRFIESRERINNYQKISTLMCTDFWVPPQDNLKCVHDLYLKYKYKAQVKHWLNEMRLVYNACHLFSNKNVEQDNSVYILLYFKSYPLKITEVVILYNWFFDVLKHIYEKDKTDANFHTSLFFEQLFTRDVNKCIKFTYLDNQKNLVSINIAKGKELDLDSFIPMFKKHVVNNQSFTYLTLVHYYYCFKDCELANCAFLLSSKNKMNLEHGRGQPYNSCCKWILKMLNFVKSKCKDNFSIIYNLFQPYLNDYLVHIPNGSNLKVFPVKFDMLDEITPSHILHASDKQSVIDLLVDSKNMQENLEYLENLNMYLYLSKYQTCTGLVQEIKLLYYKFCKLEELKSASDAMLQNSLENYTLEKRKFHTMVFQQWLVQKMEAILCKGMNLFHIFTHTLHASYTKLILNNNILNHLPDPHQKDFFKDFLNIHSDCHSCFVILLNFFICSVEYENIVIETLSSKDTNRANGNQLGYPENSIKIIYKNDIIHLKEDDQKLWNMLFNANDLALSELNAWIYKTVKHFCQGFESKKILFDQRKFEIPLHISNSYLRFLSKNKCRPLNCFVLEINDNIQTITIDDGKVNEKSAYNLDAIIEVFLQETKDNIDIITNENIELVRNIVNYVNCFLGIRKFNVFKSGNDYCVHQSRTFAIDHAGNIVKTSEPKDNLTPRQAKMSNSNHIDSLKKLDTNVIKTEAIIEHNHTRKRSLENGDTECTPSKKSRQKDQPKTSTQPIKLTSIENESQVQETPSSKNKESSKHTDLDNAIVVHPNSPVSNDRVTVFEDQFKKKLNSLNKEYSALIDITKVKIKKENDSSNNRKSLADTNNSISADNETMCNDSSDESDIVVLGPGPPKQFDVITLNENGEEIRERIDETKSNAESDKEDEESEHEIGPNGSEVMNCEGDNPVEGKEQREQDEEEDGETENNMCAYPKKWTQEMINFYTEDVNPDRFKQRIQAQLNKSRPDQWRIDYHTSYRFNDVQYGYNKMCENCGSRMHDLKSCPKPCFSVCPMCGETGHAPDRCPDAHCLNCGKKTDEYLFNCEECDQKVVLKIKCDVCHRLYHTNDLCPHLWRSMEFTTRKGKLKVLPMSAGPSSNTKYCSNCAGRGHLIAECPHLSTEHPLRQDSTWKVLSEAHATYLVHHKLKVTRRVSKVLLSKQGMAELQKLSNESGVTIEYLVDEGVNILSYKSNPVQSHYIRSQLKKFLFPS